MHWLNNWEGESLARSSVSAGPASSALGPLVSIWK